MVKGKHSVLQHIQTIFESGTVGNLTDRQLMERFVGADRDMAELCFAALVERHGPMVLRTCQSILQNRHDAEDAFQATFLVLTRKADRSGSETRSAHGFFRLQHASPAAPVRGASEAQSRTRSRQDDGLIGDRRDNLGRSGGGRLRGAGSTAGSIPRGGRAVRSGGPDPGTGCPASGIARGHGAQSSRASATAAARAIDPPWIGSGALAGLPWLTGKGAAPAVPAALVSNTTRAAVEVITHHAAIGSMGSIGALTEGVLNVMFWNKVKLVSGVILAAGFVGGTALLASWPAGEQEARPPVQKAEDATRKPADAQTDRAVPGTRDGGRSQGLSRNGMARLHVAKKLRDQSYELFVGNPKRPFTEFLGWQNRYYDVVGDVLVNTDADRVKFLEHRLAIFKRLEGFIGEMMKGENRFQGLDLDAVELDRLEIEDRLEKSRATLRASGDKPAGTISSELLKFLKEDSWTPEGAAISRP